MTEDWEKNMEEYVKERAKEIEANWKLPINEWVDEMGSLYGMRPRKLIDVCVGFDGYCIRYEGYDGKCYEYRCDESGNYENPGEEEIEEIECERWWER